MSSNTSTEKISTTSELQNSDTDYSISIHSLNIASDSTPERSSCHLSISSDSSAENALRGPDDTSGQNGSGEKLSLSIQSLKDEFASGVSSMCPAREDKSLLSFTRSDQEVFKVLDSDFEKLLSATSFSIKYSSNTDLPDQRAGRDVLDSAATAKSSNNTNSTEQRTEREVSDSTAGDNNTDSTDQRTKLAVLDSTEKTKQNKEFSLDGPDLQRYDWLRANYMCTSLPAPLYKSLNSEHVQSRIFSTNIENPGAILQPSRNGSTSIPATTHSREEMHINDKGRAEILVNSEKPNAASVNVNTNLNSAHFEKGIRMSRNAERVGDNPQLDTLETITKYSESLLGGEKLR